MAGFKGKGGDSMAKVIAIINYNDTELKREVTKGEVLEVSEARAKALLGDNAQKVIVAEVFVEPKEEEVFDPLTSPIKEVKEMAKELGVSIVGKKNEAVRELVLEEMKKSL